MQTLDFSESAPRRATNLSVNSDLLQVARRLQLNLSKELEHRLIEIIEAKRREAWLAENAGAIEAYNEHIEKSGVFSDGLRTF